MKKITAVLMALMMGLSGLAVPSFAAEAPTPEEEDFEEVFAEWNEDAPALNALIDYVEAVTDEASPDYIPPVDRIAVFDMDGTLMGELYPTYLEYYMLAWRILKDPRIEPDEEMLEVGRLLRDCALDNSFPEDMAMQHAVQAARAYSGLTLNEFADFVTEILLRDVDGFEGMTYGECFYLPMVEVVEYLQDNDFKVYVCSGSDRFICRTFIEGMLDIPYENIIGMDVQLEATGQGDTDGLDYVFTLEDDVVRTDKLLIKNLKTNKVLQIAQEIGRQPVLSFGNSSGDVSMHNYTLSNNVYRSEAFMLIADDDVRDYGNPEKAQGFREKWETAGYNVISMRDDFRTIYGDDVVKTGSFHWMEELAEDRIPAETAEEEQAGTPYIEELAEEEQTGTPSAEELADQYFRVVAGVEQGTAGASLKLAKAAAEAAVFAADHGLWDPDIKALRANLLEAWESLTAEEQAAFDENFLSVIGQINGCLEKWEEYEGMCDDAGVKEQMEMIVFDPLSRLAWENLYANTLTLGNDDEDGDGEDVSLGTLITDLVDAYKNPESDGIQKIDADVEALQDETAKSVAEHWKKVYLDPEYTLLLYGTDDPSELEIPDDSAHAFVILGYELMDGEMQDELKGRCDAAVCAAQAFPGSILVCTGGATGKNNPENHTEAGLMKDYLVNVGGIDPERIFTDESAMTTAENALNTYVILKEQGVQTMTIVTSSYHQRWGQVLYNAVGTQYSLESGYSAEIIGNFCYDTEPSVPLYRNDVEIAAWQLGMILGLPEEELDQLREKAFVIK